MPSLRSLTRTPAFTTAAVLTLGLGMGATTSIYTLLKRVVLDPLPYPHPEQLVRLTNPMPSVGHDVEWSLSTAQYFYFSQHAKTLSAIGLFREGGLNFASNAPGGEPQHVHAAEVTASMMDLLGAHAILGRLINRNDDVPGAPRVAMLFARFLAPAIRCRPIDHRHDDQAR